MTKMLIDRAVAEQALEALENTARVFADPEDLLSEDVDLVLGAITDLRAALAEPVQEADYSVCPTCGGLASDTIVPEALRAALAEPDIDPVDEYRKGFIDGQIDMRDRPEEQPEPVQELDNGGKTGWPPGLLQDDCRGLSKWLASRPDARQRLREALAEPVQEQCKGDPGECEFNGGCMYACAKPEPVQEPVAWGLFAKIDGEFVLQHPVRFLEVDVEDDRLMYSRDTVIEIRPLYTAPPQRPAEPTV